MPLAKCYLPASIMPSILIQYYTRRLPKHSQVLDFYQLLIRCSLGISRTYKGPATSGVSNRFGLRECAARHLIRCPEVLMLRLRLRLQTPAFWSRVLHHTADPGTSVFVAACLTLVSSLGGSAGRRGAKHAHVPSGTHLCPACSVRAIQRGCFAGASIHVCGSTAACVCVTMNRILVIGTMSMQYTRRPAASHACQTPGPSRHPFS